MKYDEKTITAFATLSKRKEVMEAAGIGRTKYYALRDDVEFMQLVAQRRTETVEAAVKMMEGQLCGNVQKLQNVIDSPPEKAQITINALNLYFSTYQAMKQTGEILLRLDALEKAARAQNRYF